LWTFSSRTYRKNLSVYPVGSRAAVRVPPQMPVHPSGINLARTNMRETHLRIRDCYSGTPRLAIVGAGIDVFDKSEKDGSQSKKLR